MRQAIQALRRRLDTAENTYDLRFAGHSRLTRDLSVLEELLAEVREIGAEARELGDVRTDEALQALYFDAVDREEFYDAERASIGAALEAAGAREVEATELGERANFVFHRYTRHFAGRTRGTRDTGMLTEMIADLDAIATRLDELASDVPGLEHDREVVRHNLDLYVQERRRIAAARGAGDLGEQADRLAAAANEVFAAYDAGIQGRPRLIWRPALLDRLIGSLAILSDRMQALQEVGLASDAHDQNRLLVEERLATYRRERERLESERARTSAEDLAARLGEEADAILDTYDQQFAGRDRRGVDSALLRSLCDRLDEVERQLTELSRSSCRELPACAKNLALVRDVHTLLCREHDLVADAGEPTDPA